LESGPQKESALESPMEREGIQSGYYAVSGLAATDNETDQWKRYLSRREEL
jgi:hypothetical protein